MNIVKTAYKKELELIKTFIKVVGYKVIIQKLFVFLYSNKKVSEKQIKKIKTFTIASKTKEVKDLCTENYKTLMKEI